MRMEKLLCGKNIIRRTCLVLCCINLVSVQIWRVDGDHGGQGIAQEMNGKPVFTNMLKNTISTFKKSHKNYWDKLKTLFHHAQLKFFPPDLDFKSRDGGMGKGGAGDKVKEAADKSFEATKTTAEESAKTAAKVLEETVHKAKDKLSEDKSPRDEL